MRQYKKTITGCAFELFMRSRGPLRRLNIIV